MKVLAYQIGPKGLVKVEVFANHDYQGLLARLNEVAQALREMISMEQQEEYTLAMVQKDLLANIVFESGGFLSITKHTLDI